MIHVGGTHKAGRLWPGGAALAALLLAACGGSASPSDPGAAPGWTTLGTRQQTSAPERATIHSDVVNGAAAGWSDYNPPALYPKTVEPPMQYITMPDGTKLATHVVLPADAEGKAIRGTFPTVLIQTAYNGLLGVANGADPYIVEHGYAEVLVDVRGTGQSTGEWEAFSAQEQSDYGNVVDWVAQQPFSNGTIGVYGVSYLGTSAIITAAQNHPAVKAAFIITPLGDAYRDTIFTGGQTDVSFPPQWFAEIDVLSLLDPSLLTNPAVGLTALIDHLEGTAASFQVPLVLQSLLGSPNAAYDNAFWATRSPLENDADINVPTFIVGGLHCIFQRSEPMSYERIKGHAMVKLLIGPWTHEQAGLGQGLPADGIPVYDHTELRWFDQYLKGMSVGADTLPNVTQYVLGYGHFVTASDWPNPQAQPQRLYLHGDKSLSTTAPIAGESPNRIPEVPIEGLCSISTDQWTAGNLGFIPLPCFSNDNTVEAWDAVYQTPPMAADYYLNGPIEADIWMSTTAADAGLSVRVDDVDASGNATPLTDGLQTASLAAVDASRSRSLNGQMIQPWHPYTQDSVQNIGGGKAVQVPVEIFQTSALIAKGHRLRIAVGASDLPQGVPPIPTLLQELSGELTVYSDAAHPSSVVLPVVPAGALSPTT